MIVVVVHPRPNRCPTGTFTAVDPRAQALSGEDPPVTLDFPAVPWGVWAGALMQ